METTPRLRAGQAAPIDPAVFTGMNPALMEKALDLIGDGYTYPLLYNDDILIESMSHAMDVSIELSEQYVAFRLRRDRCTRATRDSARLSGALQRPQGRLTITLHDGVDPITGAQLGLKTGHLANHATFEEFYSAYKKQLVDLLHREVLADQRKEWEYRVAATHALSCSLHTRLYDDCTGARQGHLRSKAASATWVAAWKTYGNVNAAKQPGSHPAETLSRRNRSSPAHLLEALEHNFAGYEP